eukprot:gnl/MRDRNA2_/MRDRNA2_90099_c0_seq1.p1 gnl/MRDRNA2_/MRDRNA2_90099_c0~~gnl/MRDRNA2_/MRDRNA2_90099_c0_seq1.p1  ORF type:complete len:1073 (+),score=184.19 gnl/MRDRNA2_/MRDRNA2_90099_c0_seq1:82-3300(+)
MGQDDSAAPEFTPVGVPMSDSSERPSMASLSRAKTGSLAKGKLEDLDGADTGERTQEQKENQLKTLKSATKGLGMKGAGATGDKAKRQSANRALVYTGQNFGGLLEKLADTTVMGKLEAEKPQSITPEDCDEMFAILNTDKEGKVSCFELKAILEQAIAEGDTKDGIMRALVFAERNHHIQDRLTAADFLQVVLLGSPEDVKNLSLRLHGVDDQQAFVERDNLVKFLAKKKEQHDNCKAMPVTLIFFSLVFFMVTVHLDIPMMYELNGSVSNGLQSSLIAKKFPSKFWSELDNLEDSAHIAHNNLILGGVRVSRMPGDDAPNGPLCKYSPWNYLWDETRTGGKQGHNPEPLATCYDVTTEGSWLHWMLRSPDAKLRFNTGETPQSFCERHKAQVSEASNEGSVTQVNFTSMNCSTVDHAELVMPDARSLKLRPDWYVESGRTGTLQLEAATYNDRVGFYVYKRITVVIATSGSVSVTHVVESFASQPIWLDFNEDIRLGRTSTIVVDLFFLVIYIYQGVNLFYNCIRRCRLKHDKKALQRFLSDPWVKVEFMNVFLIFMIILGYFHVVYLTSGLNQLREALPVVPFTTARYTTHQWEDFIGKTMHEYDVQSHAVLDQASRIAQSFKDLRWYITVFSFCSCLRFLKVFRANAKLNVVTETVIHAGSDLLHFLIVFLSLCMAFILVAHVLFGSQIMYFDTVNETCNSIFFMLLGYLYDDVSHAMVESGDKLAIIWSVLFTLLMILISLNMVLAIIFDVYADVKAAADKDDSLIQQIMKFWQAGRQKTDAKDAGGNPDGVSSFGDDGGSFVAAPKKVSRLGSRFGSLVSEVKQSAQHASEVLSEELQHAASEINEARLEEYILEALTLRELHAQYKIVTTRSLIDALHLRESSYDRVEQIIEMASENSEFESSLETFSMASSLRMLNRIDINTRDLLHREHEDKLRRAAIKNEKFFPDLPYSAKRPSLVQTSGSLAQRKSAVGKIQQLWKKRNTGTKEKIMNVNPDGNFVQFSKHLENKVHGLERECRLLAAAATPLPPKGPREMYPEPMPPDLEPFPKPMPPDLEPLPILEDLF